MSIDLDTVATGLCEGLTVYAAAVRRDLGGLHFSGGSTLLQYADDLLIASPSKEACRADTLLLMKTWLSVDIVRLCLNCTVTGETETVV